MTLSPHRPHTPSPSRASVVQRARAGQLALSDTAKALEMARGCPDAWYRVQALASVAEHADERRVLAILDEAARESAACHDTYGMVAVMAWPIEVALKRRQPGFARGERDRCLAAASGIEPRASQAYALDLLWSRCFAAGDDFAEPVWARIRELCHPDHNWRAARLYLHIATAVERRRPGAAAGVIAAMPAGKARSRLARRFSLP